MLGKCCCLFPDRRSTGVTQVKPSKGIFLLPEWLLMAFVFLYLLIDFIVHNLHQNLHRLCEKEKFFQSEFDLFISSVFVRQEHECPQILPHL